ncbi:acetyl-CoA carboxylase biotin carboxylase subunit family protein [Desulfococcus sp.]|uniref:ATP-grasp domain-containing protein n=1 Tax=Desulfococcus sp. TaxID=2025834 RepID=UPI003593EAB3
MNIVYLSPHFPPNYYLFCVHLKKMGANVLGIGDAAYDQIGHELKEGLTEYYRVDDMADYDQLLKACGYFTHIYGKLDRAESNNEYWIETEAKLRTDFNMNGPKIHQISRLVLKSEMKKHFRNAGVDVARGKIVKSREEAVRFIEEVGYPVVFKPDRGVGAADTFRIETEADLDAFFDRKPAARYIMEEFIEGEICSFDGLTDRNGVIVFHTAHVFSQGIMETVNEDRDIFYYSLREIPEDLEDAGKNTVAAFDIRERFFHIEFFRTPGGRLVALELNARPPGGLTTDMFDFANNIDIYAAWAKVMMHQPPGLTYSRPYHCAYIGRKVNKNYIRSHRDIMQHFGYMIVFHGPIDSIFSAAIGNYGYLVNAVDLENVRDAARFIHEKS